jgi:hypothetical protein
LILEPKTINNLDIGSHIYFLEEPMRAKEGSGIAEYGIHASRAIRGSEAPAKLYDHYTDIIKYTDFGEYVKAWIRSRDTNGSSEVKILCFTNAMVRKYNKSIKEKFAHQTVEYAPGNVLILRKPVFMIDGDTKNNMIPNNTRVIIKSITEEEMTFDWEGETKAKEIMYRVEFKSIPGWCMVPKSKAQMERFLSYAEDHRMWRAYNELKDMMAVMHHDDAGTVHSSQGSSYNEVFIDAKDIMTAPEHTNRLAYVSITRARNKAHIFVGKERNWSAFEDRLIEVEEDSLDAVAVYGAEIVARVLKRLRARIGKTTTNSELLKSIQSKFRKGLVAEDIGEIKAYLKRENMIDYEYIETARNDYARGSGRFIVK